MMSQQRANVVTVWTKKALAAGALVATLAVGLLGAPPPAHASTTFTVNSAGDAQDLDLSNAVCDVSPNSGKQCTLRAAIQEANVSAGQDTINFHIGGAGVHTISPASPLPLILKPVVINGYSQPGSSVNKLAKGTNAKLLIEINGTNSGTSSPNGGLTIAASDSVIKGLVINRFASNAIAINPVFGEGLPDALTNIRIEGNFLGTNPSGTIDRGNTGSGVVIISGSHNTLGGTSPAARNLISANDFDGIAIDGTRGIISVGNKVQGNLIGTQRDGIHALGNDHVGVDLAGDGAFGNRILSNSIFSSGELGIDLGFDGPTPNDSRDTDTGSNGLQNFPVLSSAKTASAKTTIKGSLSTKANKTFVVRFFKNPSGNEGKTFIGQKKVTTAKDGKVSFTFSPAQKVGVGKTVTATATGSEGTSEFSAPKKVVAA